MSVRDSKAEGLRRRLKALLGTGVRFVGTGILVFAALLLAIAADEHAVTGHVALALLRADLGQYLSGAAPLFVVALIVTWLTGRRKMSPVG